MNPQINRTPVRDLPESNAPVSPTADKAIVLKNNGILVKVSPNLLPLPASAESIGIANGEGREVSLQIPATANLQVGATTGRIIATTPNVPVAYNVPVFQGISIENVITRSSVADTARINLLQKGSFSVDYLQVLTLNSVTIAANSTGRLSVWIKHYDADGNKKADYLMYNRLFKEALTTAENIEISENISLTPCDKDDYLTLSYEWKTSDITNVLNLSIPTHSVNNPPYLKVTFYPNVAPLNVLGDLSFTPVARTDVDRQSGDVDMATGSYGRTSLN